MRRTFPSIANSSKHVYVFNTEYFGGHQPVGHHFRKYDTLGDGTTAHTPDYSISTEDVVDYLRSLAAALLADPQFGGPAASLIEFAQSIRYKEPKAETYRKGPFYSISEREVSARKSLEYDKRYEEVPTWADGSADAVARLLWKDHFTFWQSYVYAVAIREWFGDHQNYYPDMPPAPGRPQSGYQERQDVYSAFQACRMAISAHTNLVSARRQVKRWSEEPAQQEQSEVA